MSSSNVSLPLNDGGRVELIGMLDTSKTLSEDDIQRNVFRFDAKGNMIWQVGTYNAFPVSTFTNVYLDKENNLFGYNFDGCEYAIDIDTGAVTASQLLK